MKLGEDERLIASAFSDSIFFRAWTGNDDDHDESCNSLINQTSTCSLFSAECLEINNVTDGEKYERTCVETRESFSNAS